MSITHTFVSAKSDGADSSVVQPSDWNAAHTIAAGYFLPRITKATLTNAQILTLPSTAVQLVAAPGAGKALVYFGAFFETTYTTDYSNVHADSRGVIANANWGRDHSTLIKTNGLFTVTSGIGFLPPVSIQDTLAGWESYLLGINGMGSKTDTGFFLHVDNAGNGNFTGGNAANTLEITIFYYIVDL